MKARFPMIVCLLFLAALFGGCNDGGENGEGSESFLDLNDYNAPESKPLPTVESRLGEVADEWYAGGLNTALDKAKGLALEIQNGRIRVVFVAQEGMAAQAADSLKNAGAVVEGQYRNLIQALVSPEQIEPLSLTPGVKWVRSPRVALPMVTSQGVSVSGADDWQAAPPFADSDAVPVRVGIVDLGFQGYRELLGSELPASVDVRSFRNDGDIEADEEHGTAVAEIVYDMAPEASFSFVNISSEVDLSNAVDYLINRNVSVINHSVGWFNAGPGDGTGGINDIVSRATSRNIIWVNAAGNEAETHWEGMFTSADGDDFLDFAQDDETNSFPSTVGEEVWILMNWDDWFASDNDYDLQLYRQVGGNLELVAESVSVQNGTQEPTEAIVYTVTQDGMYHIAVFKEPAAQPLRVEIFAITEFALQYAVADGSLVVPADHPDVVAVGAANWGLRRIEGYSSRGPTEDRRTKPDITGWDGVSTSTYGPLNFWGTSAAAPHVAGALALMQSKIGAVYSPDEILQILYARADDVGEIGFDNTYGRGLLYMLP